MKNKGKHTSKRVKLPLRAYLLYLLLASFLMTGVTFSKYITVSTGGDDARVASIKELTIAETGDFADTHRAHIIPGVDLKKDAVVTFQGSEAATFVFVELELSEHWETTDNRAFSYGDYMSWSVANDWTYLPDSKYVYYIAVPPNTPLEWDVLADNGAITVSEDITEAVMETLSQSSNIFINFQVTAVQSGGFDTVENAWKSVSAKQ